MSASFTRRARHGLVVTHRWLAIVTCLLFVMWFASGLVMMYVPFPALSTAERLAALPLIEWNAVRVSPDEAMRIAGLDEHPRDLRLEMMADEPVYRMQPRFGGRVSISAVDGRRIERIDESQALEIGRVFARSSRISLDEIVERDQWSVAGTFHGHRPLYRLAVADAAGSHIYVSSTSGEVVLDTSRRERAWNWFGSVVHWLYFTELRANQPLWRQVVLWIAGIGIFVAASGLWLGIERLRLRRRYARAQVTPYRGWMAWHHLAGILGGVFVLTWIFSGWLSMGPPVPWAVSASGGDDGNVRYAGNGDARFGTNVQVLQELEAGAREATFIWLAGRPQIVLVDDAMASIVVDGTDGRRITLDDSKLFDAARHLVPDARMLSAERLEQEDAYWYSHHLVRKLPVLRVVFDDRAGTWVYIDPDTGRILARVDRARRIDRWLFSGLHRLDFRWLRHHRPAWDVVLWTLSLAGLAVAVSGTVIGWRRLRRSTATSAIRARS